MSCTRGGYALLALVVAMALTPGVAGGQAGEPAAAPKASLPDIEDEVMCPICGTALGLSESPQAERERVFIRRLIGEGKTKQEIKDALVAEYGTEVLAIPDDEGFDLLAWIVPIAGIGAVGAALFVGLRRWRRRGVAAADGASAAESAPPTDADAKRLDADLAKYDL